MTPAGICLREEIARSGPVTFHRFMEVALYHPEHGYYRSGRDPFGKHGDFYTAEQLQPVFGLLISSYLGRLREEAGIGENCTIVELGAGRGEMEEFFTGCDYIPVEAGQEMPGGIRGAVFANEFFDALPVHLLVRRGGGFRQMRVGLHGEDFQWIEGEEATPEMLSYLEQFTAPMEEGALVEVNLEALTWLDRIAGRLEQGWLLAIDYGYTARELIRFPAGTLMSYHRHLASEEVLRDPGERDLTAHVNFTALRNSAASFGLEEVRFETLARLLLRAGEADQFAAVVAGKGEQEQQKHRLQLKSLLFGMGESFQTLLLRKNIAGATTPDESGQKKSDPENRGRE